MEENTKIQKVTFGMFEERQDRVQYSDGDIVLLNNISDLVDKGAYQMELVAMMFCTAGKGQLKINGTQYTVYKDDMLILTPMTLIEDVMISPDFNCYALALSYNAIQHSIQRGRTLWNLRTYLLQHPVVRLEQRGLAVGAAYRSLLELKLSDPNAIFYRDIMHALFECLFFELASVIQPMIGEPCEEEGVRQGDVLCRHFIELLTSDEGRTRSVAYFADKLCVSTKYLSTVVKQTSGKTAHEWTHIYAIETIKRQLKYTNKSIKEIADYMRFPNLSFFGKFVRQHTGMSPTEYRKNIFDTKNDNEEKEQ